MTERVDALRPQRLDDFGGQPKLVKDLRIVLGAAKARDQVPDHILLAGPPGLGKTTLSQIIANELGLPLVATTAPALSKAGDLAGLLTGLGRSSVVFIDEIHRLEPKSEEILYSAMEDGKIDFVVGEGVNAMAVPLKIVPFILVGATTQSGLLSAPLRERFGLIGRLRLYEEADLARIVERSAKLLGLTMDTAAATEVARRGRNTPRVANKLLGRVRDWSEVHDVAISEEVVREALESFGIDKIGLDPVGRDILDALIHRFRGGPVGASTLAAAVDEAVATVESIEPFLMRRGLLARTPRGRVATARAYEHLGVEPVPSTSVVLPIDLIDGSTS